MLMVRLVPQARSVVDPHRRVRQKVHHLCDPKLYLSARQAPAKQISARWADFHTQQLTEDRRPELVIVAKIRRLLMSASISVSF